MGRDSPDDGSWNFGQEIIQRKVRYMELRHYHIRNAIWQKPVPLWSQLKIIENDLQTVQKSPKTTNKISILNFRLCQRLNSENVSPWLLETNFILRIFQSSLVQRLKRQWFGSNFTWVSSQSGNEQKFDEEQ